MLENFNKIFKPKNVHVDEENYKTIHDAIQNLG